MKINLGSGNKKYKGFLNLDKFDVFKPDIVYDLETFPYPFKDNEIEEIKMYHILEHLGQIPEIFNNIMTELYRICKNQAIIDIRVPHPRHDNYLADPTHVRPITTMTLQLYDRELNDKWREIGAANTQLAVINNVNFKIIETIIKLEKKYHILLKENKIDQNQIEEYINKYNNVVVETQYKLKVIK